MSTIKSYFSAVVSSGSSVVQSEVTEEKTESDRSISPFSSDSEDDSCQEDVGPKCTRSSSGEGSYRCECPCCSASDTSSSTCVPFQPSKFSSRTQGKQTRAFQRKWFQEYTWLSYCVTRDRVFCHVCHVAVNKALLRMPKKRGHHVFITDGFLNWKKAKSSFRKHELHKEAVLKVTLMQQTSIVTQLSNQMQNDHKYRQDMLMKVFESIQFIVRQGLPLRGHCDEDLCSY